MNLITHTVVLILYLNFNSFVICFDILSVGSVVAGVGSYLYESVVCKTKECCTKKEIPGDIDELEILLKIYFYGQHIAQETILNALRSHWKENSHSPKALTLSLHGWPGGGKNYVTGFIEKALYKLGGASDHVHHFIGRIDFPEESNIALYQRNLFDWIKGNVTKCPKQLFIFDEVDKMPPKLLNVITPFIDYNAHVHRVDFRQAIFVFLSNTGASLITEEMLRLSKAGLSRKDITIGDFESLIIKGAFNEQGGFYYSDAIKSNLIDHYIPFLPMELEQVKACVFDQFKVRGVYNPTPEHIQEVMNFIEWGPSPENRFSKTGCKRISQKVALLVQKHYSNYN